MHHEVISPDEQPDGSTRVRRPGCSGTDTAWAGGPAGFRTTAEALLAHTASRDVVKCFNTTGFNNMLEPVYGGVALDLFMAGDSEPGKKAAGRLAKDAGFAECYDVGGNDRFELMEQFAFFWINLAMMQGLGREIGFKLLSRWRRAGIHPLMPQHLALVSLVVPDYDEAIAFYVGVLGFELIEDTYHPAQDKRWVVVAPPGATESRILLARASNDTQRSRIGNQTGGRVFLFLYTDNFERDYQAYKNKGVRFVREPSVEVYGTVAVFEDLYGNWWDLVQPSSSLQHQNKATDMFKPNGYTSVSPYLTVNGAQQTIDFLVHVFGAQPLRMIPGQDGKLGHGEVRIDDTVVMLTDAVEGWPAQPSHVHIYVEDVDAIFARAVDAGATVIKEPVQSGDIDKRGGFMDAGGTTWWVSTQME